MNKLIRLAALVLVALGAAEGRQVVHRARGKIVGGEEVEPHSIPYQVSIQDKSGTHYCGGSVIREDAVLTAAQCCAKKSVSEIRVVAGEHALDQEDGHEQVREVSDIIVHENFQDPSRGDDICLLIVSTAFDFSDVAVAAVKLSSKTEDPGLNETAFVSGWGWYTDDQPSDVLRKADVGFISRRQCQDKYTFYYDILESMVCAYSYDGSHFHDFCDGDEGGPLTCDGELCGIPSLHVGCGHFMYPGIYTKVSLYLDWIESKLAAFSA